MAVSPSARAAARMLPFLQRLPLCLARNCLTVRQFGYLESIDPNDAMILPHGATPDRMKFSERTPPNPPGKRSLRLPPGCTTTPPTAPNFSR